jgi:hypothetical protein
MRPEKRPPVNLDAIGDPVAGEVTIKGVTHQVLQLDGAGYEYMDATAAALRDGTFDVVASYAQVARVLPSLTTDEVKALRPAQVAAVFKIAGGQIEEVEAMFPNAVGPAGTSSSESPPA